MKKINLAVTGCLGRMGQQLIKSCKFFLGNMSLFYPMAEALKVPRLLEACPEFPVVQPVGIDAYDFYFQPHFEKWFNYLNTKF